MKEIYAILALVTASAFSIYVYISLRKLLRETIKSRTELTPILQRMRNLVSLSYDDWIGEARKLMHFIEEKQKTDTSFVRNNPDLTAFSSSLRDYIENLSVLPEPVNEPELREFYKTIGEKLEVYVDSQEKGNKTKAKDQMIQLLAIMATHSRSTTYKY